MIAALMKWRGLSSLAVAFAILGALLGAGGLSLPRHLGPVQRGWMALALAISKVTTPVVMGLVYFVVITPIGVLRRAFGHDSLKPRANGTLWIPRGSEKRGDLTRQF
ncbi:MAG: SxtJ family membrane protein [Gemmatimonadota bacterium]|nr:SxtJ family membrane protein [Gemmatimonadota bacterium]